MSAADKLYNARAIRIDLAIEGEKVWTRFNAPKEDQLWYYGKLAEIFGQVGPAQVAADLNREVAEIKRLSNSG